jgi:phenylacetate-CoA ligase
MILVRGVNVYPTAVESIVREEAAIEEFQIEVFQQREMWELRARIEVGADGSPEEVRHRVESELSVRLGLRAEVLVATSGSLPRFELKARRFRILGPGSQNET